MEEAYGIYHFYGHCFGFVKLFNNQRIKYVIETGVYIGKFRKKKTILLQLNPAILY